MNGAGFVVFTQDQFFLRLSLSPKLILVIVGGEDGDEARMNRGRRRAAIVQ